MLLCAGPAAAQEPTPTTIPEMWNSWCARCHGKDGTGNPPNRPVTVDPMDFTQCRLTTPEGDSDWEGVISRGGPAAGLSSQMPGFGDFLKPGQVSEFVSFIRGFCKEKGWPAGNLNLPRPMFTEKAFPEDEFILAPVISHKPDEPVGVAFASIYERRIGKRAQLEAVFPVQSVDSGDVRNSGVGDVELGLKFALTPAVSNHLLTVGFDVSMPTGSESEGLGGGQFVFEPYFATATTIGAQTYLQTQFKLELPEANSWRDHEFLYNIYLGRDAKLSPSAFTFGIELNGENEEVALTPQLRKGLSKTGALAGAIGVRLPINHRDEQGVTWVGYLLWEYLEPVRSRR
jgi:hypothetical protein